MISSSDPADQAFIATAEANLTGTLADVTSARLVATALGCYEARLNGTPVGPEVLSPGWSSYQWRLRVQNWNVSDLLASANRIEFHVGNGWWRGELGFGDAKVNYGQDIAVIGTLEINYRDGTVQTISTSADWTVRRSHIRQNSLYRGQVIDLASDTTEPRAVRVIAFDQSVLADQMAPGIVRHESVRPARTWKSPSGLTLVDFGRNLVGWLRFTAPADAGRQITLRHAEVLEHGELGTRPLRHADATDTILCGNEPSMAEPSFTVHGFRYAEISGWPGGGVPDDLEAVVVHSDLARTGWFTCSDPRVNTLIDNIVASIRGNIVGLPTDCPQRDERLGWTGDIAVFASTATYLYDMADFLDDWLADVAVETAHRGSVPVVVPDLFPMMTSAFEREESTSDQNVGATCVWGDAAVWVPHAVWWQYGDTEALSRHWPTMVTHLDSVEAALSPTGLWDTGFQYADWLDPDAPPHAPGEAKADKGVVATACAHRSAVMAVEVAQALGRSDDAERLGRLADRLRSAFQANYIHNDGTITSDCATAYTLAISFGLLDTDQLRAAGDRLAALVRESGHTISTGFAGTPFVTWALTETGHVDDAYRLLLQTECPSWLYPVSMGATTIWERWDSMLPDGSINPGEMTSFNHYALGAVGDWIFRVVGGIRAASPGHATLDFRPVPGPGITWARSALDTRRGRASCHWQTDGDQLTVTVETPVPATLTLPDGSRRWLDAGRSRHAISYERERPSACPDTGAV